MDNRAQEQNGIRQAAPQSLSRAEYGISNQPIEGQTAEVIGREQVLQARLTLQKYKQGKTNLEQRIIENEQWFRLRHWECMRKAQQPDQVEPVSGWLFNSLANKHADAMDNFPAANILPRERSDVREAKRLSAIVPVVLEQNGFEGVYSGFWHHKINYGTGVYGVFWDGSKLRGLGDIAVRRIDLLNLFWEPGVTDIQMSRNLFHVELADIDLLEEKFPQLTGKLSGPGDLDVSKYIYDDTVETSGKTVVVDWYYKKSVPQGGTVLHYCKFVGDMVLFASENDPKYAQKGWYHHGLYPFHFDPMFPMEGSPCGFGYIDVAKSAQEYIDLGNQAILENLLENASPRHFVREDGSVNEKEYADRKKKFIHVDGNLGQDSIMPVQGKALNDVYVAVLNNKIDELKEVTGNRDISTGGTTSGVTAASAIAAMQEAGSKLSRDHIKASYRVYREMVLMVIELIRQFYSISRQFRITGADGQPKFVSYNNEGLMGQHQGTELGMDMGYRVPLFDIEVTAQKASPYSKLGQNEMALQFYKAGFFNPQLADQALACLDMMDFDCKDAVMEKIRLNGGMYRQMMAMQKQMMIMRDRLNRYERPLPAPQRTENPGVVQPSGEPMDVSVAEGVREHHSTRNARKRVADSTAPV